MRVRDVAHLFNPAVSMVVLRRNSHLPQFIYPFLVELEPSLDRQRLEQVLFEADDGAG